MAKDLNQSLYVEDEIDLKETFKILLESKKLIMSTILIFTIASIIYSLSIKPSFISSAKLEIGYVELSSGDRKLIEPASELISDLKVLLMKTPYKSIPKVSIDSFENKIISLKATSTSGEQNENLLTEIINFIDERHTNLTLLSTNQIKDQLSLKVEIIESEISYLKENMLLDLESQILKLTKDLPILDQEISQLNQVVIEDSNNLNLLRDTTLILDRAAKSPTLEQVISSYKSQINKLKRERNDSISDLEILSQKLDALKQNTLLSDDLFKLDQTLKNTRHELQMLMRQTQIKTHTIGNIETITKKSKTQLIVSLGVFIGFITSIFLVFINNFIKSYRENEA